jgi:hypothetical protein
MRGQNLPKLATKKTTRSAVGGAGAGGGAVPAPSPGSTLPKRKKCDSVPLCIGCGSGVSDITPALQCDRCKGADAWKCIECMNISKDVYDVLFECKELCWICPACEPVALSVVSDRDDRLVTLMDKMMDKLMDVDQQLHCKVDASCLSNLEARVEAVERKTDSFETKVEAMENKLTDTVSKQVTRDTEAKLLLLESKVSAIEKTIAVQCSKQGIESGVCVDAEQRDREARIKNVIIYRLVEIDSEDAEDRKCGDTAGVYDLCNDVLNVVLEDGDIEKTYRLGMREAGKTRPLLVKFVSETKKQELFKQLKVLKTTESRFKGIGVSHDLTPVQRQDVKRVYQEAKERLDQENNSGNAGSDGAGNRRILVVGQRTKPRAVLIRGVKTEDN